MAMHMYEDGNLNLTTGEAVFQFLMIFLASHSSSSRFNSDNHWLLSRSFERLFSCPMPADTCRACWCLPQCVGAGFQWRQWDML